MKLPHRRQFLHLAAGAAVLPLASRVALAQTYPSRPVRVIVGQPAGGGDDTVMRLVSQWLSERLGQPFVVENRPGAGTNLATEAVVRSAADGYTLLMIAPPSAINATLYDKLNFNFIRDIAPVAGIFRQPSVMVVHPSVPSKTISEFIAYAKANPGKINMASAGIGTTGHIAGELFKMMAGIQMVHVPYRGGAPALNGLIAGEVQVFFAPTALSGGQIKVGKLRALGVTTATRSEVLPDVPPVADSLPGFEAESFTGVGAPTGTSVAIIDRLNKEINAALADSKIKARLADLGCTPLLASPAEFGKFIAAKTEEYGKVIKFAGIKPQ